MRKANEDICLIHVLIKKHIETISDKEKSRLDKEVDYLLIKEAVETLIKEYNLSDDSRTKKHIKKIIIEVDKELFTYLININKYDHMVLELYSILEEIVGY